MIDGRVLEMVWQSWLVIYRVHICGWDMSVTPSQYAIKVMFVKPLRTYEVNRLEWDLLYIIRHGDLIMIYWRHTNSSHQSQRQ